MVKLGNNLNTRKENRNARFDIINGRERAKSSCKRSVNRLTEHIPVAGLTKPNFF
jgi:hypothetical protein